MEKEQSNLPSTGLIINGAVWVKHLYHVSIISHRQYNFESLKQYYFGKLYICWCVQSHPEDRGDFGQGSKENISECNNQLELSVYNMWCSYMVLTKPHMKPGIQFIIMKIFMKIVKICPKSPRFTVPWSKTLTVTDKSGAQITYLFCSFVLMIIIYHSINTC